MASVPCRWPRYLPSQTISPDCPGKEHHADIAIRQETRRKRHESLYGADVVFFAFFFMDESFLLQEYPSLYQKPDGNTTATLPWAAKRNHRTRRVEPSEIPVYDRQHRQPAVVGYDVQKANLKSAIHRLGEVYQPDLASTHSSMCDIDADEEIISALNSAHVARAVEQSVLKTDKRTIGKVCQSTLKTAERSCIVHNTKLRTGRNGEHATCHLSPKAYCTASRIWCNRMGSRNAFLSCPNVV